MTNPWEILGIQPSASKDEARKAFRKKIKEIHPDKSGQHANAGELIAQLIEAYELIQSGLFSFSQSNQKKTFDYREFLLEKNDTRSKAKLIFYDLFKGLEQEAMEVYLNTELLYPNFIIKFLDRDDALDTLFLLADAFRQVGNFWKSIDILLFLAEEEKRKPYFRYFFVEIELAIRTILTKDVKTLWEPAEQIFQIKRALKVLHDQHEKAILISALADIYVNAGQLESGLDWVEKALALFPKDRELSKKKRQLSQALLFSKNKKHQSLTN